MTERHVLVCSQCSHSHTHGHCSLDGNATTAWESAVIFVTAAPSTRTQAWVSIKPCTPAG